MADLKRNEGFEIGGVDYGQVPGHAGAGGFWYAAGIECCGEEVPYPAEGADTGCSGCGSVFTLAAPEVVLRTAPPAAGIEAEAGS